jgi:hypothetical protein
MGWKRIAIYKLAFKLRAIEPVRERGHYARFIASKSRKSGQRAGVSLMISMKVYQVKA